MDEPSRYQGVRLDLGVAAHVEEGREREREREKSVMHSVIYIYSTYAWQPAEKRSQPGKWGFGKFN